MTKIIKEKKIKPSQDSEEAKLFELTDKYQRSLADYQNLVKQKDKEQTEFIKYANASLLQDLLPVYDNLKLSLQHQPTGSDNEANNNWLAGVKYVVKQFSEVLQSKGVREVPTLGLGFDHYTMEALEEIETEDPNQDNQVAKELKSGYWLQDRLLCPAKVAVYKYQLPASEELKKTSPELADNNN